MELDEGRLKKLLFFVLMVLAFLCGVCVDRISQSTTEITNGQVSVPEPGVSVVERRKTNSIARIYIGGQIVGSYTNVSNVQFNGLGQIWFDCGNERVSARGDYLFSTTVTE